MKKLILRLLLEALIMAKSLAAEMKADIYEIQPVHKYASADLNWHAMVFF